MKKKILLCLCSTALVVLLPLVFAVSQVSSEVVVVVNKNVPVNSLTYGAIKDIYLGKKSVWGNGQKIRFVTLKSGDIHDAFIKKYVNKSASQFSSYWKKQVFTGKGKLPRSFSSEKDLIEYVSSTNGAIGYVSLKADSSSVKIITVR